MKIDDPDAFFDRMATASSKGFYGKFGNKVHSINQYVPGLIFLMRSDPCDQQRMFFFEFEIDMPGNDPCDDWYYSLLGKI